MIRRCKPLRQRVLEKTQIGPGCWLWTGTRLPRGYGTLSAGRRGEGHILAHRAMWEIAFGQIPDGLCVLHRCDNPPCVRPRHLFLGTMGDNMADKVAKGRQRNGVCRGEKHHRAKLTAEEVRRIRGLVKENTRTSLADMFGVSTSTISSIARGKGWRHV